MARAACAEAWTTAGALKALPKPLLSLGGQATSLYTMA